MTASALLAVASALLSAEDPMSYQLPAIPEGYHLQAYDDCGVVGRQPHIIVSDGVHEYSPAHVNADDRSRTVAWGWKEVRAQYEELDPALDYVLAVTYANEPFNHRVQSLWAGSVQLHPPMELPKGGVERIILRVPPKAVTSGRLELSFRLEAQVNVVVSALELFAPKPSPMVLNLSPIWALCGDLQGEVTDLRYDPVPDAKVILRAEERAETIAVTRTDQKGAYRFARGLLRDIDPAARLEVVVEHGGAVSSRSISPEQRTFAPAQFRPIPVKQAGLKTAVLSLDGEWRICPAPLEGSQAVPLSDPRWKAFRVPGQWLQQGYDIPLDREVAVAREFTIPGSWEGRRVILRFDAIHAGTRYWLNQKYLGYSENLFTPVEWDVTEAARIGRVNRLDLTMKVDTLSERLSYSCGYAFHNLGGIDRSVRLFALPQVHVRDLRVDAGLDEALQNGTLRFHLVLSEAAPDLSVDLSITGADGKRIWALPSPKAFESGQTTATLSALVPNVRPWTAETPSLYRLRVDLLQNRKLLERIERQVGFRRVEVCGSQLYVNGRRVKLAGACHHEIDPLTGRADTARHAWTDVRLLKNANLNYIRTSHYPPTDELLTAADKLGMYVEVEAPFCWVGNDDDPSHLRAVLTATSAMIAACRHHPSVILWSLANESQFNRLFEVAARMCADLDPTRPTTFNNPDPKRLCSIANLHYPPMPYDQQLPEDPRPILLGEYFFPVCHEQTDVRINPGLRELWGMGHSAPDSEWGRKCAESFRSGYFGPGTPPGTWTHIVRSNRVIGGAIWAAIDDAFYLPDGRNVGYAWHHGFWGLIDVWRRPKPEWWLAKMIFSPVWFPVREVEFPQANKPIELPVENRYSFTDLKTLRFEWTAGKQKGECHVVAAPGEVGTLIVPVSPRVKEGSTLTIWVRRADGELVTVAPIQLGKRPERRLPRPDGGPPLVTRDGTRAILRGRDFTLVFDEAKGAFDAFDPLHTVSVIGFPSIHVTRFDFGDLGGPAALPYAVLPDLATRVVERAEVRTTPKAVELVVRERFDGFAGFVALLLDRRGVGEISYDYTYTGQPISAREIGVRLLLRPECDEIRWRRWSEWGSYPRDSISRTVGQAKARRTESYDPTEERRHPEWPWALDQTELGTNDFRAVKFNVWEATLPSPQGHGLRFYANADAHIRPCLDPKGVSLHLLSECRLGPISIKPGDHLVGRFVIQIMSP